MLKLGWFSTGRGKGSRGFLRLIQSQIERGSLDANIEFVFSNREQGEAEGSDQFFKLVKSYGIPLITHSAARYRMEHGGGPISRHRGPFHAEVMKLISDFTTNISVLAGYMLITSPALCQRYTMINVHPALPGGPSGTWKEVIWELIDQNALESGVMIHLVSKVVDMGPVLTYCSFPIRGAAFDPLWREIQGCSIDELTAQGEDQPLFKLIRQEGIRREGPLLLEALKAMTSSRLMLPGGQVFDAGGTPARGIRLDNEVERFLKANGD